MSDAVSRLSEREIAELSAFADGTLPSERRSAMEARVASSPELQELVERQRTALAATDALSGERPSASLVAAVEGLAAKRVRRRSRKDVRLVPRLAFASGLAAAVAVVAVVLLTGGPGGPSVAEAALFASKSPDQPAPPAMSSTQLGAAVEGVTFPNLEYRQGWLAVGARRGVVGGRDTTVVFYGKDGARIGYAIVSGSALRRPEGGQTTTKGGVVYQTLKVNGRLTVTWRRGGHTCVLTGPVSRGELLRLASWPPTLRQ